MIGKDPSTISDTVRAEDVDVLVEFQAPILAASLEESALSSQ